jgi:hypothetical protein
MLMDAWIGVRRDAAGTAHMVITWEPRTFQEAEGAMVGFVLARVSTAKRPDILSSAHQQIPRIVAHRLT